MWTTQPGLRFAETGTLRGKKSAGIAATHSEPPVSWGTKCCWAALSYGPAGLIAERALANGVEDYLSFRAVCREWRRSAKAVAVRARGCLEDRRFYPRRWIMLREAGSSSCRRRFLNIYTGECVETELPELDDDDDNDHLLGATAEGLLALLDSSTYVVRLLNPLTGQVAELPSLYPLLPTSAQDDIYSYGLAHALQVTGLGLVNGDDAAAATVVALCFIKPMMLVVAKPGDRRWTLVESERWFYSAVSFAGRFYCADKDAVMALEPSTSDKPPRLVVVAKTTIPVSLMCRDTVHLVDGDGALFLLHRKILVQRYAGDRERTEYKAFQVDLDARKTVRVHGLGGLAVFLGERRALAVPPGVFATIRADTVYLGFDLEGQALWYCLLDGMTECSSFSWDDGWARPCDIVDYLSWYVNGACDRIADI